MNKKQEQETIEIQVTKKALLIEDHEIIQKIVMNRLEELGYDVELAQNATRAIELLEKKSYSLIVTDIGLPDKSGTEVIEKARLHELNQGTPLIVVTAHANESDREAYLEFGADDVLVKPSDLETLRESIQSCQLTPSYERKLHYKMRVCISDFHENLIIPETKDEFQLFIDRLKVTSDQGLKILQEYRLWIDFENLKDTISKEEESRKMLA
ncbi:response regulator [Rickettsiella endosymbiont of Dermanyssus gallinae]|uniref:response regulator n=1 Tax=Rickettsiella endosymbiont of Dermanyssus gallinae TaxID=2856608 RepID=UPI001C52E3B6|nr:response regulator [Rickettsiella endosymbiont of Dermanyssus gallinae]